MDLREQIAEALRVAVDYQIIAEWICCDPVRADHDLCSKGEAARQMMRSLLTDNPEFHPARSPVLDAVIAVVQPKLDDKDAEIEKLRFDHAQDEKDEQCTAHLARPLSEPKVRPAPFRT